MEGEASHRLLMLTFTTSVEGGWGHGARPTRVQHEADPAHQPGVHVHADCEVGAAEVLNTHPEALAAAAAAASGAAAAADEPGGREGWAFSLPPARRPPATSAPASPGLLTARLGRCAALRRAAPLVLVVMSLLAAESTSLEKPRADGTDRNALHRQMLVGLARSHGGRHLLLPQLEGGEAALDRKHLAVPFLPEAKLGGRVPAPVVWWARM